MGRPSNDAQGTGKLTTGSPLQKLTAFGRLTRRWPRSLSLYPPFMGAGIRITRGDPDWRFIRVEMRLRWSNRNLVGTHFGGSLFAMCDPWYMLMLAFNLGPEYVVWDRATTINFRRPGRGTVHAEFRLTAEEIATLRDTADRLGKTDAEFTATVLDASGTVVAEVEKVVYVRSPHATVSTQTRHQGLP